jgi:glycosyltransferase involved in cell wall biosynthesis
MKNSIWKQNPPRVAIVVDWLFDYGGAEEVFFDILPLFPKAEIFTSAYHPQWMAQELFRDHLKWRVLHTSFLQNIPYISTHPKVAGIFRPVAFEQFDFTGFNLVVSLSSAESKCIRVPQNIPHICYCHTPIRYYWNDYEAYKQRMEFGWLNPLAQLLFPIIASYGRKKDYAAAQQVTHFIANSKITQERISHYYKRDSQVISPWITLHTDTPIPFEDRTTYFACSRAVPYKRLDLIVDAFNANGLPIIIATSTKNALAQQLEEKSNSNIIWKYGISHKEKFSLYKQAKAFIFPSFEDFWITPIEAISCSTPVIAFGEWWATETVETGKTGIFFKAQTTESLQEALDFCTQKIWNLEDFSQAKKKFSKEYFREQFLEVTNRAILEVKHTPSA